MSMKEELKVSIIVPVHNSENTLIRCIDSILLQDYKNMECILIENGSVDNSKILCFKYAEKYKNIIFKSVKAIGVSNARNIGLSIATGDIIGFCDTDDFLEKNAIRKVVDEFTKNPIIAAVFTGFNVGILSENGNIIKQPRGIKNQIIANRKAIQLTLINDSVMGSVWNKYYRADLLKGKAFDKGLSFCEDMHFNVLVLESMQDCYLVKVISNPLYCYVQNPKSVTHNDDILFDDNNDLKYIVALKKIKEDCKLDKKNNDLIKMKIACFSIDYFHKTGMDDYKKRKLILELQKNYKYLFRYIFINDWKWNIKRILYGFMILICNKLSNHRLQ